MIVQDKYTMMYRKLFMLSFFFVLSNAIFAQKAPKTIVLDGAALLANQQAILAKSDPAKNAALQNFLKRADKTLQSGKLYSVMHKKQTPPSGDKHDYMSIGPYWWPDPSKPDGLPYIRKDGERNPEYYEITDSEEMDELVDDAEAMALAYFFTKDERYAKHAASLLKTWFLDPTTRQNPNLNFGQGIPGINTGRGIGIIETRYLYQVLDAAILLQGSKSWPKAEHQALQKWFTDFLTWLTDSPIGKDEADEHNNHGTYYDVQIIAYALFTNQVALAKNQVEITKQRMASQLKPDGSQPYELARTTSWGYVNMNLYGLMTIARLAENFQANLWRFATPDGKSIQKCVDWLLPYLKKEKSWEFQQIKPIEYSDTVNILKTAAKKYANPAYDALAKEIDAKRYTADLKQLIH